MKGKFEALPLAQLRELAKIRGIEGAAGMRKAELAAALAEEEAKFLQSEEKKPEAADTVSTEEKAEEAAVKKEAAKPETVKAEPVKEETAREEAAKAEPVRGETAREESTPATGYQRQPRNNETYDEKSFPKELDSGEEAYGIFELVPESGFGFIRCDNFLPGENDVYVAPSQIRRF